jgi:hypothetical protein
LQVIILLDLEAAQKLFKCLLGSIYREERQTLQFILFLGLRTGATILVAMPSNNRVTPSLDLPFPYHIEEMRRKPPLNFNR